MIDTDGDRDYAEEAAVRAESDAENRAEQQHADRVTETVRRLRDLAREAQRDGNASVEQVAEEVRLGYPPNVHRYELLLRQQHTHALSRRVASALEDDAPYDLERAATAEADSYTATHLTDRTRIVADLPDRALLAASARVVDLVAEVAHFAQQAATDREVEQHEQDLAQQERESYAGHPADVAVAESDSTL